MIFKRLKYSLMGLIFLCIVAILLMTSFTPDEMVSGLAGLIRLAGFPELADKMGPEIDIYAGMLAYFMAAAMVYFFILLPTLVRRKVYEARAMENDFDRVVMQRELEQQLMKIKGKSNELSGLNILKKRQVASLEAKLEFLKSRRNPSESSGLLDGGKIDKNVG